MPIKNKQLYKIFETPVWAARILQISILLVMLSFVLFFIPSLRCEVKNYLVGSLGLFIFLFGLFTLCFGWALKREYRSGFYSPSSNRKIWLMFCFGFMLVGITCLFAFFGAIPVEVRECN